MSRILLAIQSEWRLAGENFTVMPQLPQLVEDHVDSLAPDELHRVIGHATLFADGEDRHDVGVVQTGGRAGLAAESAELGRVQPAVRR